MNFQEFLNQARTLADAELDRLLPDPGGLVPEAAEAMRYSVFAGGKRLRPAMVLAVTRILCGPEQPALTVGAAVEMIHTFTLIHDDLPCIDDDDLRRGKPALHKAFGEDMAVLVGDALFNLGFESLCGPGLDGLGPETRLMVIGTVARSLGLDGVLGGQALDVRSAGKPADAALVERIHGLKTAALWRTCAVCGGLVAGADADTIAALDRYALSAGLLFQLVDDILDEVGDAASLGKTAGKDRAAAKAVYPAVAGLENSRRRARELASEARIAIESIPDRELLLGFVELFLSRDR